MGKKNPENRDCWWWGSSGAYPDVEVGSLIRWDLLQALFEQIAGPLQLAPTIPEPENG